MHSQSKHQSGNPETVGGRLKYWRKVSRLRLVDVASLIHVSQGSLSDLENDKSLPSAATLTGLCQKTDMNLYWLLTGEGLWSAKRKGFKRSLRKSVNLWLGCRIKISAKR